MTLKVFTEVFSLFSAIQSFVHNWYVVTINRNSNSELFKFKPTR